MGRPKKVENELEKLLKMIEKAPADKREGLRSIAEHLAFVKVKLDEGKAGCAAAGLTVEYNNGGGQSGIRENPLVKAYTNLLKIYIDGMKEILRAIPEVEAAETEEEATVLDFVMKRRAAGNE